MCDFLIKVVLVGNQNTGKSTLIHNYISNHTPTIGVDFASHNIIYNNKNIKLHIWDTSGNLSFLNVIKIYLKNSVCAIIVFSLNDLESFNKIDFWYNEIVMTSNDYKKFILIGTYIHENFVINPEMIHNKCIQYNFQYYQANEKFLMQDCLLNAISSIFKDYREMPYKFRNLEGFKNNSPKKVTTDYINFDNNEEWSEEDEKCKYLCCKKNCYIL